MHYLFIQHVTKFVKTILNFSLNFKLQLNSCNSNSCNSKDHLNQTNSSVPSEFTSKLLQENSFNSNSHNSKNHVNRTNFGVSWTYFSSCNSNFVFLSHINNDTTELTFCLRIMLFVCITTCILHNITKCFQTNKTP